MTQTLFARINAAAFMVAALAASASDASPVEHPTYPPPAHEKRFAITMATIGHWKNGTMDHEWLFWDGQDFMKQLGLAK